MRCEGGAREHHIVLFFSNPVRLYSIAISTNSRQNGGSVDRLTKALFWVIRFVKLWNRHEAADSRAVLVFIYHRPIYCVKMMQQQGHVPLFQFKSTCKTFKMSLMCMKMNLKAKHIFI